MIREETKPYRRTSCNPFGRYMLGELGRHADRVGRIDGALSVSQRRIADAVDPAILPESNTRRKEASASDYAKAARSGPEVESLEAKRPEVIMPTFGIRAPNSRDSVKIISAGAELLTDALDPVQPKQVTAARP